jgi:hypothetical protein
MHQFLHQSTKPPNIEVEVFDRVGAPLLRERAMRRAYLAVVVGLGGLLVHMVAAHTSTSLPNLEHMVSQANAIFLGSCHYSESHWDESKRMIFTDYVFRIEKYLKGYLGPTITITQPGGVLPELNLAMIVPHFPRFHENEEVVLFVWTDLHGTHHVLGASQGKYNVELNPITGRRMIQGAPLEEFLRSIELKILESQQRKD